VCVCACIQCVYSDIRLECPRAKMVGIDYALVLVLVLQTNK